MALMPGPDLSWFYQKNQSGLIFSLSGYDGGGISCCFNEITVRSQE